MRGRIVALLAESGGTTVRALTARLADARVPRLAAMLAHEGLVEVARGRIQLPIDPPPAKVSGVG